MNRAPFVTFEVAIAAELPDTDGSTFYEQIRDRQELTAVEEEAIGYTFTVYGRRPDPETGMHLATAISDFPFVGPFETVDDVVRARTAALDLAYALADGKPVQDNTDVLDA